MIGRVGPPHAPGQGAGQPLPVLPDAEIRHRPDPRQGRQPGEPHPGYGPKDAEIGEIVRQRPHAGVQPAELPVVRPDSQAQRRKGGKEHQGQVRPPGILIGGRGSQNRQRERQSHEQQVRQDIVAPVKDGADQPTADGKPHQHGEDQRQSGCRQQGRQAYQRRS